MDPELIITTAYGSVSTVPLTQAHYTLGRSTTAELSFPDDPGLSRQHLTLERNGNDWTIADLGSRNGTSVNGTPIKEKVVLRTGDRIRAGQLSIEFRLQAVAMAAAAPSHTVVFRQGVSQPISEGAVRVNLEQLLQKDRQDESSTHWLSPLTALLRAGRELVSSRPLAELFQVILDLSIECVGAERGVLMTVEGDELVVQASRGEGFRISSTVRDTVVRERTSLLVLDTAQDLNLRDQASIIFQHVRTLMAVPLQTDERVIGLLYLDTRSLLRKWTADDLSLLTVMANVAAIRVERERLALAEEARRLLAQELDQAAEIQRRFLPAKAPAITGLDLAGHNVPCRTVGGDYYDFLTCPSGRLGLILGDVAGKGMPAALMMMNLQARVQVLAETVTDPAEFMVKLNRVISNTCPQNRFITLFLSLVDATSGRMLCVNAGHNPALLVRANGAVERITGGGPILGVLRQAAYESQACQLSPGDLLCLYSDGVTEACDPTGEEFGEDRLADILSRARTNTAAEIVTRLNQTLALWTNNAPFTDDSTLLVAKRVSA